MAARVPAQVRPALRHLRQVTARIEVLRTACGYIWRLTDSQNRALPSDGH